MTDQSALRGLRELIDTQQGIIDETQTAQGSLTSYGQGYADCLGHMRNYLEQLGASEELAGALQSMERGEGVGEGGTNPTTQDVDYTCPVCYRNNYGCICED